MLRALRRREGGDVRIQRDIRRARQFQTRLLAGSQSGGTSTKSRAYFDAQLAVRREGEPCAALGEDGSCAYYAARPLACRVYVSVEDPAHCEPDHAGFSGRERPPLWVGEREARFEQLLKLISAHLGLKPTPNLAWAVASLHAHPLGK